MAYQVRLTRSNVVDALPGVLQRERLNYPSLELYPPKLGVATQLYRLVRVLMSFVLFAVAIVVPELLCKNDGPYG